MQMIGKMSQTGTVYHCECKHVIVCMYIYVYIIIIIYNMYKAG